MATLGAYGIIAVKFSAQKRHLHYISHVLVVDVVNKTPVAGSGRIMLRENAVQLSKISDMYTYTWNYTRIKWIIGAEVDTEMVNKIEYLRTKADTTARDNLLNLIELDFLMPIKP